MTGQRINGDGLEHISCPLNGDRTTLCGQLTAHMVQVPAGYGPSTDSPSCVVCRDHERSGYCPQCGEVVIPTLLDRLIRWRPW